VTTVLVADDDQDIRELVELKLSSAGYDVLTFGDGQSALDALFSRRPDLAVLDVMMPGLSGTDVLRALRQRTTDEHDGSRPTKVILLTAKAQEADVEIGFALGADDYVVKPFSPRELLSRVQAVLGREYG
jgi:DNA-binding response OmpR family regulator